MVGTAAANDASFGGAGADLYPLAETRVRMQSEEITLRFDQGHWRVRAEYVFVNDGPGEIAALRVGFPELRCHRFGEDCRDVAFEQLVTRVDGEIVQHQPGQLSADADWAQYLGVVWLYDVSFPVGREVHVDHSYFVRTGADNSFSRFTSYVTRTGSRWAGPIGRARFRVMLPPCAHTVTPAEGIALESIRTVTEGPDAPYVEVVYDQRDWEPEGDLWVSFNCSAEIAAGRIGATACPSVLQMEADLTEAQRTACRDLIYASRGFPFASEALRRTFYQNPYDWRLEASPWGEGQVWARGLRPFDGFEPSWIDWPEDSLLEAAGIVGAPERQGRAPVSPKPEPPPGRVAPAARGSHCGCSSPAASAPGSLAWVLLILGMTRRIAR